MKQNDEDVKLLENHDNESCDLDAFIASLGIECIEVIPPINSTVCCVRRADRKWAAFEFGNKTPIVDFGKYSYMWSFDGGYCVVDVATKDSLKFASRGIINEKGEEVVKPYTFQNIWNFYGSNEPYILVQIKNEITELNKSILKLL